MFIYVHMPNFEIDNCPGQGPLYYWKDYWPYLILRQRAFQNLLRYLGQGRHGEFEPGKVQYSTKNYFVHISSSG